MKIIEWLKTLKLIEKKIESKKESLKALSSLLSNEKPLVWESVDTQTKEVTALLQGIFDLENEYITIKCNIEKTNNVTTININGKELSVTWRLTVLRKTKSFVLDTIKYVNTKRAEELLTRLQSKEWITIIPCFDSKKVSTQFNNYRDMVWEIEAQLEIINATTDMIE